MTRILIADDHDVVRSGVRSILESHDGWEVVAEAKDGKEAIDLALATRPDVVVLDYALPLVNGVEATRQIRTRVPGAEVLIFTMHDTDSLVRDVLEAGARGFLLKSDARQFLISAVESSRCAQAVLYGQGVGDIAGNISFARLDNRIRAELPREGCCSTDQRRKDQQANRRYSQHQHQDSRDSSRHGHAQTQSRDDRGADPIRDPKWIGGGMTNQAFRRAILALRDLSRRGHFSPALSRNGGAFMIAGRN